MNTSLLEKTVYLQQNAFDSKSDALTLAPTTCCSPGDLKQNQTSSKSPLRVLLNWQFHERFSTQSKFATVSQTSVPSLIT